MNLRNSSKIMIAIGALAIGWYFVAIIWLTISPREKKPSVASKPPKQAATAAKSDSPRNGAPPTVRSTPQPSSALVAPPAAQQIAEKGNASSNSGPKSASLPGIAAPAAANTASSTPQSATNTNVTRRLASTSRASSKSAAKTSLPPVADVDVDLIQFMALSITAIGGTLATFVGMVIGMNQVGAAAPQSRAIRPAGQLTTPQLVATWAYVASLVLALAIWMSKKGVCDPAIAHLGQSFLGLVGGALTVMLNVTPQSQQQTAP